MPGKPKSKLTKPKSPLSQYTYEKSVLVCEYISTSSMGLGDICEKEAILPDPSTVRRWLMKYDDFRTRYARAKVIQADILAEECLEIADTSVPSQTNVDRLRIDTRKWLASKLLPKVYGDTSLLDQKTDENEQLKKELFALRAELDERNKKPY